jgi:hypothetical protein
VLICTNNDIVGVPTESRSPQGANSTNSVESSENHEGETAAEHDNGYDGTTCSVYDANMDINIDVSGSAKAGEGSQRALLYY